MFLSRTVESLLANIRGNTEIIIVLDGAWADPGIPDDPRITIIYHNKPVGQRAATNEACRISKAKYVMKIDAHCSVDEGFDVKLMADMQDDWTVVPAMYNLHAFNWKCNKCGKTWYQSPTPLFCCKDGDGKQRNESCDSQSFERVMIWQPRLHKKSLYYRFDKTLHFQYWGDYGRREEAQGDIAEILSIQGSCFMLTREKYWELNICDEKHGSWGQQGVEVACKTWLSGGKVVVNKKTWYAHMFRTQGGDFGFPYPLSGGDVDKARKYSRELWLENKWPQAIHTLDWLLEKFKPVPDWHDHTSVVSQAKRKGIIYYTDNKLTLKIARPVQNCIKSTKLPIVSASLKKMNFGKNIYLELPRGYLTMAKQILSALEASDSEIIYFTEHDVLYDSSHFEFTPEKKDVYYYNTNIWEVRADDGHALYRDDNKKLSQLVGYRDTLITHFKKRVELLEKKEEEIRLGYMAGDYHADEGDKEMNRYVRQMGFEPGSHNRGERVDDLKAESFFSKHPSIDIRHDTNTTPNRWKKEQFRNERYTRGWKEAETVAPWNWEAGKFMEFLKSL